jgi:hypothetical protein
LDDREDNGRIVFETEQENKSLLEVDDDDDDVDDDDDIITVFRVCMSVCMVLRFKF